MTITAADVRPDEGEQPAEGEPAEKTGADLAPAEGSNSALTLRRGQTLESLSPEQSAALSAAFNFDPFKDKTSWPHIQAFIHFCLTRGFDPISREAYLIKRGDKFTIQTGIDGFRRKAHEAHLRGPWRYRGLVGLYWTSDEDSSEWWFVDPKRRVRERLWVDAWIWPDKNPAAARAVIEYENEHGEVREASWVAHWGMFAPYNPVYEGPSGSRRKKLDPATKKPLLELAEMWRKDGGAHMLAKCALAAVLRDTFPSTFGGLYAHEEMHKADVDAAEEARQKAAEERLRRMQEAQAERAQVDGERAQSDGDVHDGPVHTPDVHARTPGRVMPGAVMREGPPVHTEPVHIGDAVADVAAHMHEAREGAAAAPEEAPDDETRRGWLLDEIALMAEVMQQPARNIVARRLGQNPEDASPEDLIDIIGPLRDAVIGALRNLGQAEEADAYSRAGTKLIAPVDVLLGSPPAGALSKDADVHTEAAADGDVHADTEPAVHAEAPGDVRDGEPEDVHDNEPHPFYPDSADAAVCMDCPEPADAAVHQPPPGVEE